MPIVREHTQVLQIEALEDHLVFQTVTGIAGAVDDLVYQQGRLAMPGQQMIQDVVPSDEAGIFILHILHQSTHVGIVRVLPVSNPAFPVLFLFRNDLPGEIKTGVVLEQGPDMRNVVKGLIKISGAKRQERDRVFQIPSFVRVFCRVKGLPVRRSAGRRISKGKQGSYVGQLGKLVGKHLIE